VKYSKLITAAGGLALILGVGIASADVVVDINSVAVTVDNTATQHKLVGSDTLNELMDCLTAGIGSGCPGKVTSASGITTYVGQGSGQGQRQMEGSPKSGTDELPCTVGGAVDPDGLPETNPGCQEIAPMSGEMDKGVCDDDITTPGGATGVNASAESMAICGDGIVVVTDNASLGQFAAQGQACPAIGDSTNPTPYQPNALGTSSGGMRKSGVIPADASVGLTADYTIGDWKDVLRLIYTGCESNATDGLCASKDHYLRCTDPARRALVNHWSNIIDSTATSCGTAVCTDGPNGGLRAAYRRDDSSGTSKFFLQALSLTQGVGHRSAIVDDVGKFTPIPVSASTGSMFCDGGESEGFVTETVACTKNTANACLDYTAPWTTAGFPKTVTCPASGMCPPPLAIDETAPDEPSACTAGAAGACRDFLKDNPGSHTLACPASGKCPTPPSKGDPITKACAADDILCGPNGRIGLVRALISPPVQIGATAVQPWPTLQCTAGKYAYKSYVNVSINVCPDGTKPKGGQCLLPYFQILQNPAKPFNATTNPEIGRDYRCLTPATNHTSLETASMDARPFNAVVRDQDGLVVCLTGTIDSTGNTCTLPAVAQWRQRMAILNDGVPKGGTIGTVTGTSTSCQNDDATRLIGCVTGSTTCTMGFAGREVAEDAGSTAKQEPFTINASWATDANVLGSLADKGLATPAASDYVFARFLYLGALGGFHNLSNDCLSRGGTAAFCADELALAQEFTTHYNDPTTGGGAVCAHTGFIALPPSLSTNDNAGNPVDLHECRSTLGNTAAPTQCGAPGAVRTVFPKDGTIVPTNLPCTPQ
jgi:hypothetical protein